MNVTAAKAANLLSVSDNHNIEAERAGLREKIEKNSQVCNAMPFSGDIAVDLWQEFETQGIKPTDVPISFSSIFKSGIESLSAALVTKFFHSGSEEDHDWMHSSLNMVLGYK